MKPKHIYSISRGYRKAVVWQGSHMTSARISTSTLTPNKGLTRAERHAEICRWLVSTFSIPGPVYRPSDNPAHICSVARAA